MPMVVFLDTSVLPVNPIALSAEFRALAELADENEVNVHMSSVAYREWTSKRQGEFIEKADACRSALHNLLRDRWSPTLAIHGSLVDAKSWFDANKDTVSQAVHNTAAAVLDKLNPTVLPINGDHAPAAFDSYFQGNLPFASIKARDDIPDAFILESLKGLAVIDGPAVHAAIRDKRLRQAASALPKVNVYESLKALFEAPEIANAQANLQRAGAWQAWLARFRPELAALSDDVESEIRDRAIDVIAYRTVHHDQIPDDNSEGTINGYDEPSDIEIDWDNAAEFGVGILSVPVEFDVDVHIDFSVFHMDAYTVPEGVSVSYGDPEHDHFFEAEATVSTHVSATVVFRIPEDEIDELTMETVSELAIVEEIEIEVLEHTDFRIFH